jgi:hypothetical protein
MTSAPTVEVAVANGVATLTLRGEKSVNVMGRTLVASLVRALEALRQDTTLRLVVISGPPGGSFQGGVNIAEMADFTPDAARDFITLLHQACHGLRALPVPSIARIEGYCLGGGMELAAACDLRIGAHGSRYGMPEVQVGLPSVIEARLLPALIGWGHPRAALPRQRHRCRGGAPHRFPAKAGARWRNRYGDAAVDRRHRARRSRRHSRPEAAPRSLAGDAARRRHPGEHRRVQRDLPHRRAQRAAAGVSEPVPAQEVDRRHPAC